MLYDQLVAATGLSRMMATGVLNRCCSKLGLSPDALRGADVPRLLPLLEPAIKLYLPEAEVAASLRRLQALCTAP